MISSRSDEMIGARWLTKSINAYLDQKRAHFCPRTAIVAGDRQWTYDELFRQAEQLSARLKETPSASKVVLLFLKDGGDATSGVLAGIFSGFCSITVHSPLQLKSLLSKFPDAALIFRGSALPLPALVSRDFLRCFDLDSLPPSSQGNLPAPQFYATPETPVQAVLTSGSTGEPKAVAHGHSAILNQIRNYSQYARLTDEDRIAVIAPLASITGQSSLFGALLNGATACFYNIEDDGVDGFADWIQKEHITVLHATPTIFRALANIAAERNQTYPTLRLVRVGGEPITVSDLAALRSITTETCSIYMGYGCSEMGTITRLVTDHDSSASLNFDNGVPVGEPSGNVRVEICDTEGNPLPDGQAGEVVVSSRFLSLGYLNDDDATSRSYSLRSDDGERSYKTGDMGVMRNGELFLRGRLDRQVKVRGHRIEMDAVESQLSTIPGFGPVVVEGIQVRFNGNPPVTQLYAFLSPRDETLTDPKLLRKRAAETISPVMIPAKFVVLSSIPKTKTGKIDRKALRSQAESLSLNSSSPDTAPTSNLEAWLLERWVTLLHNSRIHIHDDFFEIGGDSMTAVRLFHEIADRTGCIYPVSTLLEAPTIAELAKRISDKDRTASESLILTLRDRGSCHPLFLIHDIGGNVLNYRRLAQELGDDQPVYGVRSPALDVNPDTNTTLPESVEALAALYIEEITASFGDRPIALSGLSFGGKVAFEMAQQLHRSGRKVTFLGLLDTRLEMKDFRPNAGSRRISSALRNFSYHCRRGLFHLQRIVSGNTEEDYLQERIRKRRKKRKAANGEQQIAPAGSRDRLSPEQRAAAWHRKLGAQWSPQPSSVPIHYFSAMEPSLRGPFDNMANWNYLGKRGLQVDYVKGNHISLLEDPHAATLARALTQRMLSSTTADRPVSHNTR